MSMYRSRYKVADSENAQYPWAIYRRKWWFFWVPTGLEFTSAREAFGNLIMLEEGPQPTDSGRRAE